MSQPRQLKPLTLNALAVLERRYLWRDSNGTVTETPEGLFSRVAHAISVPEKSGRKKWQGVFFEMMASGRFLPNTPTLMNAGRDRAQLSACFVLPIEDSLEGIFDALKGAAKIHQSGGGTGFSFSRLRPKGSLVRTTRGVASGPISFMRVFDLATETVKQGGARRGANMAVLRVDHPDILEFINVKRDLRTLANFNISVGVTEAFMRALELGKDYALFAPGDKKEVQRIGAREVFEQIVAAAWECGDPGLVFLDRINFFNPTPRAGQMESTNPCGEQALLGYESCNLGSLNLGAYWNGSVFDWEQYRQDIHHAVRFLDNVIEVNCFPLQESRKITLKNRKIGLGVMGLADLLLMMDVPYESDEALRLSEKWMSFLDREAKSASMALAKTRGAFPNWRGSLWQKLGYPKMRNATVSTVAPTGTISMIAGCSGGIEPIFAGIFYRNVLSGERLREVHPAVEKALRARKQKPEQVTEEGIAVAVGKAWSPAQKVSIEGHVRMQAVFQRHSDSSVSKTINLPQEASREDVARAFRLAHQLGCKGITVYRDKSRPEQVLEKAASQEQTPDGDGSSCPTCVG